MYHLFFNNDPRKQSKTINRIMVFSVVFLSLLLIALFISVNAQNNVLILNGGYIKLNGGTSGIPVYLVVNHNNAAAISRTVNGGLIISENEYNRVKWNIRTGTGNFEYPLGVGSAYIPFKFNITSAGTESAAGSITVSSWYTAANAVLPSAVTAFPCASTENDAIDRFWQIDALNYSVNPTATIRFGYDDPGDLDGISEANLQAQRWNAASPDNCKWESPVGTVDAVNNFVEVANISDFSPWVLVNKNNPLPIELLEFTAKWKDKAQKAALLQWKTAAEINNDYFEIQRSNSLPSGGTGWAFETIKVKKGAGNSSSLLNYEYVDNSPSLGEGAGGWAYYRLKQVDYDGTFTYSNIEAISKTAGINLIVIYPNPSNDYVDYLVYSTEDVTISVFAVDAAGKIVISEKKELKKGVNKQRLHTSHLSSGTYILQVTANEETKTEKQFVIQ